MKKITYLTLLMIVAFVATITAQDFEKDLAKMAEVYGQMENFDIKVRVNTYQTIKDAQPMFTQEARVKKSGSSFFYDVNEVAVLVNKKCMVMVEKQDKRLTYSPIDQQQKAGKIEELPLDLDVEDFKKQLDKVTFLGTKEGANIYAIKSNEQGNSVEIHISNKTKVASKIIYQYGDAAAAEGQLVIIDYPIFNNNPSFAEGTFSENKFVNLDSKGAITKSGKYRDYQLVVNKE